MKTIIIKGMVQKLNPTATAVCSSEDCIACHGGRGEGGNCRKSNVKYEMECLECPEANPTIFVGETAWNLFIRATEYFSTYKGRINGAKNNHLSPNTSIIGDGLYFLFSCCKKK